MASYMRFLGLLLLALAGVVQADALPDPTQPPGGFSAVPQSDAMAESGLRLQSVLLPSSGRPTAIISGHLVGLGDRVGDGRLTHLTETGAVIVGPQGKQRLQLTPEVEKLTVQENHFAKASAGKNKDKKP